jgi:hypothetical protein
MSDKNSLSTLVEKCQTGFILKARKRNFSKKRLGESTFQTIPAQTMGATASTPGGDPWISTAAFLRKYRSWPLASCF